MQKKYGKGDVKIPVALTGDNVEGVSVLIFIGVD
jgi:hypothetical protein